MTNQTPESVIDDSVVEAAYRAFCEARFGKALSDDEHDALRSRLELTWMKPTIAAALRAANMLREPGKPDAATAATAAIERVTAERDAAMARIAKAWELHEPFIWSFGHGPVQSCKWCADHGVSQEVASWPCPTVAALDGAPEPEWEYRAKVIHPDWVGNHYIVFKHEPTRDELENPVLFNDSFSGVNELEGGKLTGLEYRTPASDWLPVEGESKP